MFKHGLGRRNQDVQPEGAGALVDDVDEGLLAPIR